MTLSFADRGRPSIYTYVSKLKKAQRELYKHKPQQQQYQQNHQQERYQQNPFDTSFRKETCILTPLMMTKNHLGRLAVIKEDQIYSNSLSFQSTPQTEQNLVECDLDDSDLDELESDDLDSEDSASSVLNNDTSYMSAWKKLNGLESTKCYKMAISVSLSPIFLAAANVARQRRQHAR